MCDFFLKHEESAPIKDAFAQLRAKVETLLENFTATMDETNQEQEEDREGFISGVWKKFKNLYSRRQKKDAIRKLRLKSVWNAFKEGVSIQGEDGEDGEEATKDKIATKRVWEFLPTLHALSLVIQFITGLWKDNVVEPAKSVLKRVKQTLGRSQTQPEPKTESQSKPETPRESPSAPTVEPESESEEESLAPEPPCLMGEMQFGDFDMGYELIDAKRKKRGRSTRGGLNYELLDFAPTAPETTDDTMLLYS